MTSGGEISISAQRFARVFRFSASAFETGVTFYMRKIRLNLSYHFVKLCTNFIFSVEIILVG